MTPAVTRAVRGVALIGAVASASLCIVALASLRHESAWITGVFTACAIGAVLIAAARSSTLLRFSSARFTLVCLAAFLLTRSLVILAVPTEPVSDFRSYLRMAEAMSELRDLNGVYGFFAWGYPVLLAPIYALFGPTILVAQIVNLMASAACIPLLYRLGRLAGGERTTRVIVLLFLCWPPQWMLASVTASEHFALLGTLAVLNLALLPSNANPSWRTIAMGVIMALTATVRPVLGVLLPVTILAQAAAGGWRRMLVGWVILVAAYACAQSAWHWTVSTLFHRRPPTVMWWNLLAGSNYEARGQWNVADTESYKAAGDQADRDAFARKEVWRRVTNRGPLEHLDLARRKMKLLWGDGTYGVYWATHTLRPGQQAEFVAAGVGVSRAISQALHAMLLALAAIGCWRIAIGRPPHGAALMLLLIASGTAAHVIFETQSRYSYVFMLGVLFLAAWALRPTSEEVDAGAVEKQALPRASEHGRE